ncbi:Dna methyltransferase [Mycena indigotica]|uniref:tRNA (cytosine(38)-C(5))-methyltransferase n=1 Tax=Mycena indigotica TaxID=2126181 RepID=A0A8H6SVS3_9AGAR|nr:Dna methyltransferase [Mycena indigotica]KAF7306366.1 Dna methyltransferase [Mycena indigotica]
MRALEFYSGIGGLHLALERSKVDANVVHAFDWDRTACEVYSANFGPGIACKTDISIMTADYLASLNAFLWLLSPACQPYTVLNPQAKGELDPRAQSFLHLVRNILPELATRNAHPTHFLVENVAGFETSTTRQVLVSTFQQLGYTTAEFLLTPLQFGIPNSRLRYYLLAKRSPYAFRHSSQLKSGPLHFIPGRGQAEPRADVGEIREYLDEEIDEKCVIPDKVLLKWGRLFDIVLPSSQRTCCFTRGYTQLVERAGSILQLNEELDTTTVFDAFLAQKSAHNETVRMLDPLRLRYFSPNELLRLFAFSPLHTPPKFVWPSTISRKTKYRLIGNSVNVRVVQELISYLLDESDADPTR